MAAANRTLMVMAGGTGGHVYPALAVADALAAGRSVDYQLSGRIGAIPEDGNRRDFEVERRSALSPAPGLPGVMR